MGVKELVEDIRAGKSTIGLRLERFRSIHSADDLFWQNSAFFSFLD